MFKNLGVKNLLFNTHLGCPRCVCEYPSRFSPNCSLSSQKSVRLSVFESGVTEITFLPLVPTIKGTLVGEVVQSQKSAYSTIKIDLPTNHTCNKPTFLFEYTIQPKSNISVDYLDRVEYGSFYPRGEKTISFNGFQYFNKVNFVLRAHCYGADHIERYDRYLGVFSTYEGGKRK